MSGPAIAARVREGVRRGSVRLSEDGSPLECTVTRTSGADETVYPPTQGTPKDYVAICALGDFELEDRDGSQITAQDVRVLVTRPLVASDGEEIEPSNGDTLSVSGKTYSIVSVRQTNFAGYSIMWTCQCRRAG